MQKQICCVAEAKSRISVLEVNMPEKISETHLDLWPYSAFGLLIVKMK
jgi:hypothetical protein